MILVFILFLLRPALFIGCAISGVFHLVQPDDAKPRFYGLKHILVGILFLVPPVFIITATK